MDLRALVFCWAVLVLPATRLEKETVDGPTAKAMLTRVKATGVLAPPQRDTPPGTFRSKTFLDCRAAHATDTDVGPAGRGLVFRPRPGPSGRHARRSTPPTPARSSTRAAPAALAPRRGRLRRSARRAVAVGCQLSTPKGPVAARRGGPSLRTSLHQVAHILAAPGKNHPIGIAWVFAHPPCSSAPAPPGTPPRRGPGGRA
eukprot:scaffold2295_cov354-Prasinococcus_capsulatus_cf.AAC.4